MRYYSYIILCLGILLFSSCTPEEPTPDQEKIYLDFSFVYNKTISKSTAIATFRQDDQNGSKLELTNPANIQYNSNLLIFNPSEAYYKKEFIGKVESNFFYSDLDNDFLSNTVTLNDSIAIDMLADSHSISTNLIVPISASNFLSSERLEVELLDLNSGNTLILHANSVSSGNMMIEAIHLGEIGIGEMIITLRRIKEIDSLTESKDAGGELKVCYEVQDTISLY